MKSIAAFFRLIRFANLMFIALAQLLFRYCIVLPTCSDWGLQPMLSNTSFALIILSSILIAASGNIINDYFDQNIDSINKPEKMIIGKYINRRWVLLWHLSLSLVGIAAIAHVAMKTGLLWLTIGNVICVLSLFIYSISLKKQLLSGNVLISLLTAWVLLILTFAEFQPNTAVSSSALAINQKIYKLGIVFSSFAFLISLIREVVKDMEDVEGDRKYGCKTIPIVWGFNAAKIFVSLLIVFLIACILIIQLYLLQYGWWMSCLYALLCVVIPLSIVLQKLMKANTTKQYHQLSQYIKFIMLSGMLSMLFFLIEH